MRVKLEEDHARAAEYTEREDIAEALRFFVDRVRAGELVAPELLAFIADGVDAHLRQRKPWPARRGVRGGWITPREFAIYHAFTESPEFAAIPKSKGGRDAAVGKRFAKSGDGVQKIVARVAAALNADPLFTAARYANWKAREVSSKS